MTALLVVLVGSILVAPSTCQTAQSNEDAQLFAQVGVAVAAVKHAAKLDACWPYFGFLSGL